MPGPNQASRGAVWSWLTQAGGRTVSSVGANKGRPMEEALKWKAKLGAFIAGLKGEPRLTGFLPSLMPSTLGKNTADTQRRDGAEIQTQGRSGQEGGVGIAQA